MREDEAFYLMLALAPVVVALLALIGAIAFYRTRKRPDGTVSTLHVVFAILAGLLFLGIAGCYGTLFVGSMM